MTVKIRGQVINTSNYLRFVKEKLTVPMHESTAYYIVGKVAGNGQVVNDVLFTELDSEEANILLELLSPS